MTPLTLAGIALSYRNGTATPTNVVYNQGRFGDGRIAAIDRNTVLKIGRNTQLALQGYDTVWYADSGRRDVQWLERVAVTRTISRESSLAIGMRRIQGTPPSVGGIASYSNDTNVSLAYALHRRRDELYVVYGDASALQTKPALIVKYVFYLGGEKGT
jgi:hypothetical protein